MSAPNFFTELKRRNVYKVAVAYAVVGWLVMQVAVDSLPHFDPPAWAIKVFVVLVAARISGRAGARVGVRAHAGRNPRSDEVARRADTTRWPRAGSTSCLVGAALAIGLFFHRAVHSQRTGRGGESDKSIAVLPLVNQSGDRRRSIFPMASRKS